MKYHIAKYDHGYPSIQLTSLDELNNTIVDCGIYNMSHVVLTETIVVLSLEKMLDEMKMTDYYN